MFGLTLEKLFLVALIAGVVLGPARLPDYARHLARSVRSLRQFVDTTRAAAEQDLGMPLRRSEWESVNLRQYDPRRIVRDALEESSPVETTEQAAPARPGRKYVVAGTSSHPVRVPLDADDPRRVAARPDGSTSTIESPPPVAADRR
ncbi:twin-arginine translocase TatA/TatE family subunit [Rhodococcus kroppenstedtii]|uniref:twin-arginine translocase TatA/TatE family subunit n=1 Tax=Rhodococcoides kroppenstedtii TaxID=293050 RepID=UPI00169AD92D|nr:twin-arginine translocase TatA/TatE family subunit [Rhodococcus kroppenstedtii]MDV7198609.1 twin-arginine translocase TatA/TatE family subunit [Rhodococcus kroppenstedtii]NIL82526.1 Sec-independent protein translocase protein TatB [Rhodococcus kroppenstedtii]